ncbi:MAG: hypothetical protein HUK21_01690 [Fibrobacteraceae bacterium]|nr:hypothetical protein [Fibrobacteraceae bacterium]
MKKMNQFLMILTAAVLAACSSMEVSEEEALSKNFPDRFDANEYVELHQELFALQIMDSVSAYNKALGLSRAEINLNDSLYLADTAKIHKIFVTRKYAGFREVDWEKVWTVDTTDTAKVKVTYNIKTDTISMKLDSIAGDTTAADTSVLTVYDPKVTMEGKKPVSIAGYSDSARTQEVSYTLSETLKIVSLGTKVKSDTLSRDTARSIVGFTDFQKVQLKRYNFYDTDNDIARLDSILPDVVAISYQYILYGREYGWPYRKCDDNEKDNNLLTEEYPNITKLYCADENGDAREID